MLHYAVKFDRGGHPIYKNVDGKEELQPIELGQFETMEQAIEAAQERFEATQKRPGVFIFDEPKKGECVFMVVSMKELLSEFK